MAEIIKKPEELQKEELSEGEANLQYFWDGQGVEKPNDIVAYDKKIMFDVPLTVYLDKLEVLPRLGDGRNKLVGAFEDKNWLPKSPAEARMVAAEDEDGVFETKGPGERLRRAKHTGQGNREDAQHSTLSTIDGYREEAKKDISILNRAIVATETENKPDINTIRSDPEILNTLADYLHGREILDRGQEYSKHTKAFKNRQRYWRGFMQAAVQPGFASDQTLLAIYEDIREKVRARSNYWTEQTQQARQKVGRLLVKDVQDIVIEVKEDKPEAQPPPQEPPKPGLQFTEDEETRIDKLRDTMGLGTGTAAMWTSKPKGRREVGRYYSSSIIASAEASAKEREERELQRQEEEREKLVELLRTTNPTKPDSNAA